MSSDAETEVQLLTDIRRRSTLLHQGIHGPLYSRHLKFRERHGPYLLRFLGSACSAFARSMSVC